jgi:hypothetical protein
VALQRPELPCKRKSDAGRKWVACREMTADKGEDALRNGGSHEGTRWFSFNRMAALLLFDGAGHGAIDRANACSDDSSRGLRLDNGS